MKKTCVLLLLFIVSIPWNLYGTKPKSSQHRTISWKHYRDGQEAKAQRRIHREKSIVEIEMPEKKEMTQQKGCVYRFMAGMVLCLSHIEKTRIVVIPAAMTYDWYYKQNNRTSH